MSQQESGDGAPEQTRGWSRLAGAIVWLRFLIVPLWIALTILAATRLPSIFDAGTGSIGDLVPNNSSAIAVEEQANQTFGIPLLSRTLLVASAPGGLSRSQVADATAYVARLDRHPPKHSDVLGGVPLVNVAKLAPGSAPKTLVVFLFIRPSLGEGQQTFAAQDFADRLARAARIATIDVSGPLPARFADAQISTDKLPWVELATLLLVVGILGFYFRAIGVPLLGLATVAIAYLCASHVLGWLAQNRNIALPQEVEPVMVALLFGVLTDYLVFFGAGYRQRLDEGLSSREAARLVTAELLPVVLTAGLMIAGATLTLLLSGVRFLTAFGPGLAIAVTVGVAVALTFVPAMLALIGPTLLAPGRRDPASGSPATTSQGRAVGLAARFPVIVAITAIVVLAAAATGLRQLHLGDPVMKGLPASNEERQGYEAAAHAFNPGIAGPTMIVARGPGIAAGHGALATLESQIRGRDGVAAVVGPADQPVKHPFGVVVAQGGNAVRFLVLFDSDPESAAAIDTLAGLQHDMPQMLAAAGLSSAQVGFAGDTAITQELTDDTSAALLRVLPLALLVLMVLVWSLLRTRAAPVYLVATSMLVVAAALGITVYVFQNLLGYGEISFFVPVTTTILLVALGSDYNVFLIGRIWLEAEHQELRAAVRTAGSRAARAIAVAGVILALSFAAIAIIPILAFREIAFAMAVGLLLDAFVARPLLIPALVLLFEGRSDAFKPREPTRPTPAAEATSIADPHGDPAA